MKRLVYLFMICCLTLPLFAEDKEHREMNPHMLRVGWGDQHFEYIVWHATDHSKMPLPVEYVKDYNENFRYTQHWWAEYQYRQNSWFSYGGLIDGSGVLWDVVKRNGPGVELARDANHSLYNLVITPTIYFTYFHHQYVSLHSGLGIGMNINGGTEKDAHGRTTVVAPALNLTLIGVSAWYKSWFASLEFGTLASLSDGQHIYMLGSRLFSASIGVTF